MKAITVEQVGVTGSGARIVKTTIVADVEPATPPTTGNGIAGLNATDVFAPMSILFVTAANATHKVYIAGESGQFVGQ